MNQRVAPLASVEDLSEVDCTEDEDEFKLRQKLNRSSIVNAENKNIDGPLPRVRMFSQSESESETSRQHASGSIPTSPNQNFSHPDTIDKTARHHMVLVHMKPQHGSSRQTYLVTPVRSASCLSAESSGIFCRICHEGDGKEDLISPCRCTGTMGLIHVSCIEKWLSQAGISKCEICGFEYVTEKTPRSFHEWFREPSRPNDKRNFYGDLTCFLLLTPLAGVSTWLCLSGAIHYSQYEKTKWETAGLVTLAVFLILIYFVWCMVALRYHIRIIQDWRKVNQVVRIRPRNGSEDAKTDENNNNSPSTIFIPTPSNQPFLAAGTSTVSPDRLPIRNSSMNVHSVTNLGSLARNLTHDLMSESPVAASSPVQMENSTYPDILEGSAVACSPGAQDHPKHIRFSSDVHCEPNTNNQSDEERNLISHVCRSNGRNTCKGVLYRTYVPLPRPSRTQGSCCQSLTLPRSFVPSQCSDDASSRRAKYVRVRSSLSESAFADYNANESSDSCKMSVPRVVKETYV